ncbi:hypothetical protein IMCC26134_04155 [Verrucomicrobia bacterium IMCC26134]|jgi:hypothetical protein|nr:hypothetical protein IMCC26134_04155 [Verrucomicrobia bacterium IMCC26134]
MDTNNKAWQERFGLTVCNADEIEKTIPANLMGIAVIYATTTSGDVVYLVVESRAGSLITQTARRLQTAKFPLGVNLRVAFKTDLSPDKSPAAIHEACREQVILAGAMRRELRPAMR